MGKWIYTLVSGLVSVFALMHVVTHLFEGADDGVSAGLDDECTCMCVWAWAIDEICAGCHRMWTRLLQPSRCRHPRGRTRCRRREQPRSCVHVRRQGHEVCESGQHIQQRHTVSEREQMLHVRARLVHQLLGQRVVCTNQRKENEASGRKN